MKNKKRPKRQNAWHKVLWKRPWMRNSLLGLALVLLTGVGFLLQQYAPWLGANLIGVPTCVQDSGRFVTFPVAGVVSEITRAEIEKAILDRKISTLHGKGYGATHETLKNTLGNLLAANDVETLTSLQHQEYQDGGHIGIDIPIWWADDKDNVPVLTPFNQAQVYKVWRVGDASDTWGNAVTLCFTNATGTYFAHFAHMKDAPMVLEGTVVRAGEQLGLVGNTGLSYGAHMHFQINRAARYNPYYTSKKSEIISTFVDPLLLALKPTIIMDNVLVAGTVPTGTPSGNSGMVSASIFDISLRASSAQAAVGEKVTVTIEAKDQNGSPVSGKVKLASTAPVSLPTEKEISNGKGEITVTSQTSQEVQLIVASPDGTVSKKIIITFQQDTAVTNPPAGTPVQQGIFTDVLQGSVSSAEYEAIKYLKEQGITTGNPDGSFGIHQNLNRAAAATFLIRAFYPQINLNSVQIGSMPFSDVDVSAWYAAPIYIANVSSYQGIEKPVFIKGSGGRAMPASDVKLEEFAAMILRVLKVDVPDTEPWYDGYLRAMQEIGILSQSESAAGLGRPMSRKLVARILHQALIWQKAHPNGLRSPDIASRVASGGTADVIPPKVDPPSVLSARLNSEGQAILEWNPSVTPNIGYNIYRSETGESFELITSNLTSPAYLDIFAKSGRKYFYRVEAQNLNTGEKSTQTNMVEIVLP